MRNAAEERDLRIAEEEKRGDEGHEEEMLDHVGAEERVGEAVHGGGDGEPDGCDAEVEADEAPGGEECGPGLADGVPAACVEDDAEEQRCGEEEWRGPFVEDGPVFRWH